MEIVIGEFGGGGGVVPRYNILLDRFADTYHTITLP